MSRWIPLLALWAWSSPPARAADRPNVLIVVIDDAGYSDLGAYGGDAATPVIDALAARGTKLARFYATPQCGPTRAMLLTGADHHQVGLGTINEALPARLRDHPAYTMVLDPSSVTLGEHFRAAGYFTMATGKWGIGKPGSSLPEAHGFDRSHVLDASGADNWEQKPYLPVYDTAPWYADGQPVQLPEDFYSSAYIADRTIELLDQVPGGQPFFAMVGFQAIHLPVQAPRAYIDHYNGTFDDGWGAKRAERAARVRALGLVPRDAPVAPVPDTLARWDDLTAEERALKARMMQVNAGMLEAMDHHLGRILAHLDRTGRLDPTLVVVLSDNGPEPGVIPAEHDRVLALVRDPLVARIGEKGTTASIGPEWATVSAAPLSLFKWYTSEGGVRVPLVIAGPGIPSTPVVYARAHVADVLPTVLDLAGVPMSPADPGAPPMRGRSLRPALLGEVDEVYGPDEAVVVEVAGNAALFRGPYKIVKGTPPFGGPSWRLYDVVNDPGETRDLSADLPELAADMRREYEAFAAEVQIAEMDAGYDPVQQIARSSWAAVARKQGWKLGVAVAFLVVLFAGIVVLGQRWLGQRWRRGPRSTARTPEGSSGS